MRSFQVLPRRQQQQQQFGRICDACRKQRQQSLRRNIAPFSTTTATGSASSSWDRPPLPRAARPTVPGLTPTTTRCALPASTGQIRTLRTSSSSPSQPDTTTTTTTTSNSTAKPLTHYDLFPKTLPEGPPPAGPFHIDVRALRREYLALQASAHPDLHPPGLKARAEGLSARLNDAFATLSNPFRRAVYVLDLKRAEVGSPSSNSSSSKADIDHDDEGATLEDPELLGVVLEAREAVEEAQEESELEDVRAENEERIRTSEERIGDAFARDDLAAAAREVVRLRYWVNIKESVDNWEKGKGVVLEH